MRIYVVCDMEGASGLRRPEQVLPGTLEYAKGQEMLMADVNEAVAGAFEGGATNVVVCDSHGGGGNLVLSRMDSRAAYVVPTEASPMPLLDESFAGVMLIGQHAMAGTLKGFLDHTVMSSKWFEFRINGEPVGEIGIVAARSGAFGVPLIMVSGDEAACREAQALCPAIVVAAVKKGLNRSRVRCISPARAHGLIRASAAESVCKAHERKPWRLETPVTAELTFCRTDYADVAAGRTGAQRVNARTVRRTGDDVDQVLRF